MYEENEWRKINSRSWKMVSYSLLAKKITKRALNTETEMQRETKTVTVTATVRKSSKSSSPKQRVRFKNALKNLFIFFLTTKAAQWTVKTRKLVRGKKKLLHTYIPTKAFLPMTVAGCHVSMELSEFELWIRHVGVEFLIR